MAFRLRKPPSFSVKHKAYAYQLDAVLAVRDLRYAAVFHEQGLGKTKIAIDLMLQWLEEDAVDTVFVVTKKTLVQNWVEELAAHSHVTPSVLSQDRRRNSIALNSPVLIYVMNYEVISANLELIRMFLDTCRVAAILDESQKIKNPESKLTQHIHSLAERFERRVIMTGTPVANRPFDIWSQIKFLDGGQSLGQSFAAFKAKMDLPPSKAGNGGYGRKLAEVMANIGDFAVRETKETAGIRLPDKTIVPHFVRMESRQQEVYDNYKIRMRHELRTGEDSFMDDAEHVLKRLLRLVQCASNPALVDSQYAEEPAKLLKLREVLAGVQIDATKVIVWTSFVENVEWLRRELPHYAPAAVHGGHSTADRNSEIRRFKQDGKCRMLVATPGAAKEGLTLTMATHAVFFDRGFSLDDYIQAQDRIHRISQHDECFVHNLMVAGSIDEWVDALLHAKHHAAQLTQGDMRLAEFREAYTFDISDVLKEVLGEA